MAIRFLAGWCAVLGLAVSASLAGAGEPETLDRPAGKVRYDERWLSPEEVAQRVSGDPAVARYREKRPEAIGTAQGHFKLAHWCRSHGLPVEARAHLLAAARLDPSNAGVQLALGRKLRHGRWLSDEEYARALADYRRGLDAYLRWRGALAHLRPDLLEGNAERREQAELQLSVITDPHVVPALEEVFSLHGEAMALEAVSLLSRLGQHQATRSLVRHAVWSAWAPVRQSAVFELTARNPEHYMLDLIEYLRPARTNRTWLRLPNGRATAIFQWQDFGRNYVDIAVIEPGGWDVVLRTGRISWVRDIRTKIPVPPGLNRSLDENALRIRHAALALERLTGETFGSDQRAWWQWWGKASQVFLQVPSSYGPLRPSVARTRAFSTVRRGGISCFVAGTPVWTRSGPAAIDRLQPGDLVLAMDPATGELAFKPVVYRTVRPRTAIKHLHVGDETIGATLAHPVWVAGRGWVKVKDLKEDDPLRTYDASARLIQVTEGREDIAFNLEVAEFGTYFVAKNGILVHDNTPILESVPIAAVEHASGTRPAASVEVE